MRHPTDGTLRRLLDEPAGVADADREHAAGCPCAFPGSRPPGRTPCLAGAALDVDLEVSVDSAWQRSRTRSVPAAAGGRRRRHRQSPADGSPQPRRRHALRRRRAARRRRRGRRGLGPDLPDERIAPIAISRTDLLELPDLPPTATSR